MKILGKNILKYLFKKIVISNRSHALIDGNEICSNLGHGIQCNGNLNYPVISKSNLIGLNYQCGIHISNGSHAIVTKNYISRNSKFIIKFSN